MVAELGASSDEDQIYRLTYDGSVGDEERFAVMGGQTEAISAALSDGFVDGLSLGDAVSLAVRALAAAHKDETLAMDALEVAVLDRLRQQPRKFRRIRAAELGELVADGTSAP